MYNIDPALWGGNLWNFIHYLTFAYSETPSKSDMENMKTFFELLKKILPCEKCRYHYSQNLTKKPLTDEILKSRYRFIEWAVDIHNEVNKMTGKPIMTVDDAIQKYMYTKSNTFLNPNVINIIALVFVIIVIILICR